MNIRILKFVVIPFVLVAFTSCGEVDDLRTSEKVPSTLGSERGGGSLEAVNAHTVTYKDGDETPVKVYTYSPSEPGSHHVIFKYSDLIKRAERYKSLNRGDIVKVRLALYKISTQLYVGVNPEKSSYGKVNGWDFAGDDSEKLTTSIELARDAGVDIKVIYQNPLESQSVFGRKDPSYIRKVTWGSYGSNQMHAKFLTMEIIRENKSISHAVYVSTANADPFGANFKPLFNVAQSGLLMRGNSGLQNAYARYFDVIWNNYKNQSQFIKDVRQLHSKNTLNYEDDVFSVYFFPTPGADSDANKGPTKEDYRSGWVDKFNPITDLVQKAVKTNGKKHIKLNTYFCKTKIGNGSEYFSVRLGKELTKLKTKERDNVHIRSAVYNNNDRTLKCPIKAFDGQALYSDARTHEKNMLLSLGSKDEFYSVIGSANLHYHEFTKKANTMIVVKESKNVREIYDSFKSQFYQVAHTLNGE